MYQQLALTGASLLLLSACVSADKDMESSSDEYVPEGYDPEAGPAEPKELSDGPHVPEKSEEGPKQLLGLT